MSNKRVNPFKLKLHLLECEADEKDKKISDLEAKLAESEKQRQHLKDWLDNEILTSVDSESYYATINEYEEEVKKLKQRLEESESELVLAKNTSINTNKMEILHLQIENEELKQQLAEKDQDKISFAIEQLEKVKDWCKEWRTEDEFGVFTINVDDELNTEDNLLNFTYNQIEELKKEIN